MSGIQFDALSYLGFRSFKPSANLSEFVDSYWFVNTSDKKRIDTVERLHPNGGYGLILNYCDPLQFDCELQSSPCILDGTNTFTRTVNLKGSLNLVGIRFKPAGAYRLLNIPLCEIKDHAIPLDEINYSTHYNLFNNLLEVESYPLKVLMIEDWLIKNMRSDVQISGVIRESLSIISRYKGILPINELSKSTGHNQRKIERLFNSQVGMTPKEYSRTLRASEARFHIKNKHKMLFTDLAYDLGYYDQAHFIKQFKKVVGVTPREYYKQKVNSFGKASLC